jgi:hypothetical protein
MAKKIAPKKEVKAPVKGKCATKKSGKAKK